MENEIIEIDWESAVDEYISIANLNPDVKQKFDSESFVILPSKYDSKEYYYAQETIDFVKFCKSNSPDLKMDVLDNNDIVTRSLHSFSIWLPVIWVATNVLLPFAVSLVASYVHDKLKGRENESPEVDVTFEVHDGKKCKKIHYNGDISGFKEKFENIDLTKL